MVGARNVAELSPTAAAVVHEITGCSPRYTSSRGSLPPPCSHTLNVAIAMPMAKKSTQFGGQIVATRSHDGWAVRK